MHPGGKGCVDLVGLVGVDGGCGGWQLEGGGDGLFKHFSCVRCFWIGTSNVLPNHK